MKCDAWRATHEGPRAARSGVSRVGHRVVLLPSRASWVFHPSSAPPGVAVSESEAHPSGQGKGRLSMSWLSFSGRIGRMTWWLGYVLVYFILIIAASVVDVATDNQRVYIFEDGAKIEYVL